MRVGGCLKVRRRVTVRKIDVRDWVGTVWRGSRETAMEKEPIMLNAMKPEAKMPVLTEEQLAHLGEGLIAYVKAIRSEELGAMFPEIAEVQPGMQLFALLGASGKPLIVTDSRDAALANAMQNELHMVSLH